VKSLYCTATAPKFGTD